MKPERKTAVIVGILFIIATAASIISIVFLTAPILDNPNYLIKATERKNQLIMGVLFQLIAAFGSASIAIFLYPAVRRHNEALALGSVGFRIIEAVFYIVAAISISLVSALSHEYVTAGSPDASYFQTLGNILLSVRDWGNAFGVVAFCLGAWMYYSIFYQSKLVPRWLSLWGFIAIILLLAADSLVMFGIVRTMQNVLVLPIALQEMVLAVWLIVKGFNPSAIASALARYQNEFKQKDRTKRH